MVEPQPRGEPDLSALRMDRSDERPARRRVPRLLVGGVAVVALLAAAYFVLPIPWLLPEVDTAIAQVVTPAEASSVLTAAGYTYARERAAVGAKIIGRVVRLYVDEGDRVRRGDRIAVLDNDNLVATVEQARARLLEADATLADARRQESRLAQLLAGRVVAQEEYDAAATYLDVSEAGVAVAQANLAAAEAQLGYSVITAPIDGVVIERMVEVGEMVAPGGFTTQQSTGAIVRLADPESLEVEADINEAYISRIEIGQPAIIRVDAVPGVEYRGRLRQIVPTADRQRAVVEVKVTIDDRDERILPDMSCNVTFLETEPTAGGASAAEPKILVPRQAVVEVDGSSFVFVVEGDRLRRTAVELGAEQGDRMEIASGLGGGEVVVREATNDLEDGRRVRARR